MVRPIREYPIPNLKKKRKFAQEAGVVVVAERSVVCVGETKFDAVSGVSGGCIEGRGDEGGRFWNLLVVAEYC